MAFFSCPYATPHGAYLICAGEYKDGAIPAANEKAYNAFCPYQHRCTCDGKIHVSERGKQCYEKKRQDK